MIFTELRFLFFFVVVFGVHWLLRREGWRKTWLLGCSYVFYAGWDWRFLFLLVLSTLVDYVAGWQLDAGPGRKSRGKRLAWLLFSLTANFGLLGFFKYFHFFVDSGVRLLHWLGLPESAPALHIILPVGISFYTFQTLSYTLDVYRGKIPATRNLRDFASVLGYLGTMFLGSGGGTRQLHPGWWLAVAGFTLAHFGMYRGFLKRQARALPDWAFSLVLGVAFGLAFAFSAREVAPFVYFQF